jgi:hypothetical protein
MDYAERLDKIRDKWRWMPGMKAIRMGSNVRIRCVLKDGTAVSYDEEGIVCPEFATPDLTDPATQGCLEAQLREKEPRSHIHLLGTSESNKFGIEAPEEFWWHWVLSTPQCTYDADSREDAILIGLENL